METPKLPPHNIIVLAQQILKLCFLMPFEGLSNTANICLALICHLWILLNSSPTIAVIIYQVMVGIEDVYAIVESIIGVFDYISFIYICICYSKRLAELQKIFNDIGIFLEFSDRTVIENAENDVQFYTKFLTIYFCLGVFLNGLLPLMNISECRENRQSDLYQKYDPCGNVVRNLYPFDTRGIIRTSSVNIAKAIACYLICIGFLGVTMVLIGLFIHILAQIKNFKKKLMAAFDIHLGEREEMENFKACVRYHITIINYTERVFAVFNMLILVHVSITSIIFGLILFYILKLENYADKLRYAAHLAGWLAMLFITCYYGQRITDESASIAEAAYFSSWYKSRIGLQKSIYLMILRAQRPLTLKAASVGVISLVTFFMVIKGAYSFFTVMITVSD